MVSLPTVILMGGIWAVLGSTTSMDPRGTFRSSATIWVSPVITPWPISALPMKKRMRLSGSTCTQAAAFSSGFPLVVGNTGSEQPVENTTVAPAASHPEDTRNRRRL